MHVNNEIGVIQDIQAIGEWASSHNILFHVDAAQSIGKLPIDLQKTPIDLLSMNAHKIYGPKGIGALYVRKKPRVRVAPQMHGGGHEQGMRSGTLATHQIVGMGYAFELALKEMHQDQQHHLLLRNAFCEGLKLFPACVLNTDLAVSLPNIVNLRVSDMRSEDTLEKLSHLALSKGSACLSKGIEPSYVLRALGQTEREAASAVRFSWGRFTTLEEINQAINSLSRLQASFKL